MITISSFKLLERVLKPCKMYNLYYFQQVKGFSMDSRSLKRQQAFIAIRGKHHNGHRFIPEAVRRGASLIIAEKYIPTKPKIPFFLVNSTYDCLKTLGLYIRKKKKPFVYAITGSIGKTTTKEMLSFLLASQFKVLKNTGTENNLLGLAKTIFSLRDEKVMVLELGTSQKGEIESLAEVCIPDIGIITSVQPVHLEGLKSLNCIYEEKFSLLKANPRMKVILNRSDSYLARTPPNRSTYWFGKDKSSNLFAKVKKRKNGNSIFLVQDKYKLILPVYLEAFIDNALAAISGAHFLGFSVKQLTERMNEFVNFPPMRMEMKEFRNCLVLNDAYNANPYSFKQALKGLRRYRLKKIAVIGDMLELGKKSQRYHKLLAPQIIKTNFNYCLTFGNYVYSLGAELKSLGYKKVFHFSSHKAIADFINKKVINSRHPHQRYMVFLKGSRAMELEKVINYLK